MKKNSTTVRACAVIGIAVSTVALSSCGHSSHTGSAAKPACTQAPKFSSSTPTVAVLGQIGKTTDVYRSDLNTVITGTERLKGHMTVGGIGSDANAPSLLVNSLMAGEGNNSMERTADLKCKEQAVSASIDTLHGLPDPKPLDDFGAIMTLAGELNNLPKGSPVSVVLLGSLMNTAGLVNFDNPETLNNPVEAINQLTANQLMPNCTAWRVYGVGGGEHANPPLDDTTIAKLREFWRLYFARCGGALVDWSPHLATFPIIGDAIPAADTTQIPITRNADKVTATLSGDVLFDAGQSELRPAASAQLGQVLQLVNQTPGRIVIDGYTDVGGDETDNIGLSQRRAATVRDWLSANGIDPLRITPIGHGSAGAIFASPRMPDEHQANRRVVVTIFTN